MDVSRYVFRFLLLMLGAIAYARMFLMPALEPLGDFLSARDSEKDKDDTIKTGE